MEQIRAKIGASMKLIFGPMFDVGTVLLEVFLFDFDSDLYGKQLDVAFVEWIRHELRFDTIAELVRRMDEDARVARTALSRAGSAFPPIGIRVE